MTDVTLKVKNQMVLCPDLEYTKYQTNTVNNLIEEQTLEKGYQSYSASSADQTTITWSIPSISGGAMTREMVCEVPVTWTISC